MQPPRDPRDKKMAQFFTGVIIACLSALLIAVTFRVVRWVAGF